MPDKRFHVFVRTLDAGVAVQVMVAPHLVAFADTLSRARIDLAKVLVRLLERGELWDEVGHFDDARLRKIELDVRAISRRRLLEVPMRFSVLSHGAGKKKRGPTQVLVPRLGVAGQIDDAADVVPFAEELIRNALHLAPLGRLLDVAYSGEEALDSLTVSARPPAEESKPAAKAKPRRAAAGLPPGLSEACRFLNAEAEAGLIGRAFQRDAEVERLGELLGARVRASVLLVGPPAAGKTALVHELVHRAREEEGGLEVYTTSGSRIIAGMRYFGEWQGRVDRMLASLRTRRAVLHIESLGELIALGADDGSNVARHLLPAVEAGEVSLLVETTPEDRARAERSHGSFIQALRALSVPPLVPWAARIAIGQTAARLGRARRVAFSDAALDRALDLAERFGDGVLPGSAVEILRTAAGERVPAGSAPRALGPVEVTAAFSTRTGYPAALVDPTVTLDPGAVRAALAGRVVGQDAAIELFVNLIVTLKTNLADPKRPLGTFLLLGPTGVGKTESALALAATLFGDEKRLARFDMAEMAAPGSALRLVATGGAESTLAKRVRAQPFGVVLLDEIEKADSGVHDLLLQILGEGRLTDATGRTVSFKNTIVLMTSNLGAEGANRSLGFSSGAASASLETHYRAAAAAFFRPELLNRIDHIVPYRSLAPDVIARLAERAVKEAIAREGLALRGVRVTWDRDLIERLVAVGFDARLGARPLKRAVERLVVAPLARVLAAAGTTPPASLHLAVDASGEVSPR